MKKSGVLVLVILLLISVISSASFVSAGWLADFWNKITGKVAEENVTTAEPVAESITEPAPKPSPEENITCTDSDGGRNYYMKGTCTDSSGSYTEVCAEAYGLIEYWCENNVCANIPKPGGTQEIAECAYGCLDGACLKEAPPPPTQQCTDSDGGKNYYVVGSVSIGTEGKPWTVPIKDSCIDKFTLEEGYCENENMLFEKYKCPNGCKDGACIRGEEPKPPVPEVPPTEVVSICAAKIKINFDKTSYIVGEQFEVKVGVFDSQENPVSDYPFYAEMYDDRWHTPDLQRTGADGYFRHTGTAEKLPGGITKVKFKVYTKEIGSCRIIEDTTELEIRQAPVPCGIGGCVPEEEIKEVKEIPKEKMLYSCSGCELESKCYPIGYRKAGQYCTPDYEFVNQIEEGKCENNFECKSNVCISGECVSESLMKKIINWFKKLFGIKPEPEMPEEPKLERCSELLIEKDIGGYEYNQSAYGEDEHSQAPIFLENGDNIGTIKCCVAQYIDKENKEHAMMFCPYGNRKDVINSVRWLIARESNIAFGEYKGNKVFGDDKQSELIAWTSDTYLLVVGLPPNRNIPLPEDIADAYLKKYSSDFDLTEDDIPYVEPKSWVPCTEEDKKAVEECLSRPGSKLQTDPHPDPDKDCEVYKGCILSGEDCERITDVEEREDCYIGVADRTKDASVCEKITSDAKKEKCYIKAQELPKGDSVKEFLIKAEILGEVTLIDFETLPDGTILQNKDRLSGKEWETLGVIFEFPSEDYLQVFGPLYPFNPLDKLSLSPGLGPFEAGGDTHDDLNIIFSEPVKAVGIYLLDLGETDERESITFFDKNNNIIKKISPWPKSTFGNPAPGTFVSLIHKEGISKIEILENTQDSDDIAYDNLYFVK